MNSARITVPGVVGVFMMGASNLAYALVTPCDLTTAPEFHSVPLTLTGCSFEMQMSGLLVTAVAGLVGFVFGWVIKKGLIGHR